MNEEKDRRAKRSLVQKDVIINGIIKAEALDISMEGMYIYTQANFITGAVFEIRFKVNNHNTLANLQCLLNRIGYSGSVFFVFLLQNQPVNHNFYIVFFGPVKLKR